MKERKRNEEKNEKRKENDKKNEEKNEKRKEEDKNETNKRTQREGRIRRPFEWREKKRDRHIHTRTRHEPTNKQKERLAEVQVGVNSPTFAPFAPAFPIAPGWPGCPYKTFSREPSMEFCAINFPELASQVNAKKENIPVVQHSRWGPFFRRLLIHPVEQKDIMTRGTIVGQRYPNVQTLTCQLRVDRRNGRL